MHSTIISNILEEKPVSFLFHMHLPKVGGVTIRKKLGNNSNFIDGEHKFCVNNIQQESFIPWTKSGLKVFPSYLDNNMFSRSVTFAVIRNPFDWLASYYYHYSGSYINKTEHRGWCGCVDYHGFKNFNEFIDAYCDPLFKWHVPPLKNFIPSQLFDKNGRCRADFILLNEKLDDVLNVVARYFNLNVNNIIGKKKINSLIPKKETLYTDELQEKIMRKCKREFDLFGYEYEGFNKNKVKIPFDGICMDMSRVKYDIYSDELIYDNVVKVKNRHKYATTFWPQYHFQRAESLYKDGKYLNAKSEMDLLLSILDKNPDYPVNYNSNITEARVPSESKSNNTYSAGSDINKYRELEALINEKILINNPSNTFLLKIKKVLQILFKKMFSIKNKYFQKTS